MFNPDGLKILPGTNNKLRTESKEIVDPTDPKLDNLIKQMIKTLKLNNGIGLAAPQIGNFIRLFIIEVDYTLYIMINPKIKNLSRNKIELEEGCLSFPGMFKPVQRSKKVSVKYLDQTGKKHKLKAKGLLARAIQHEMDHLNGVLIVDRVKNTN
jgi:peptide deformylase